MNRLNLVDPDLYLEGVPREYFRWLRDNEPVAWHDEPDGPGYWVLTRFDDVVAANRNWELYSNSLKGSSIEEARSDEELIARRRMFVNQDPPQHTRYRKLVSAAFTPGQIRRMVPLIQQTCSRLVDRLLDGTEQDFVPIAEELSFQMVATLFGVPETDWPGLIEITRTMADFQDPEVNPGLAPRPEMQRDIANYALGLIAAVRSDRKSHSGVVADLVNAEVVDEGGTHRLTDAEIVGFFPAVLVGGLSTTAHAMTEMIHTWATMPKTFDGWLGNECPTSFVEEFLRWRGPVMSFRRTATADHQLHDSIIKRGDKVLLSFASANHDDRHFNEPELFDPTRDPLDHVAFGGGGPHFCIGAQLARMDLKIVFSELLTRIGSVEPVSAPQRLRANQFAGWLHYPIRMSAL
ncbi:MAG: cytochrome P450 [Acidimicrobiales bacterium]